MDVPKIAIRGAYKLTHSPLQQWLLYLGAVCLRNANHDRLGHIARQHRLFETVAHKGAHVVDGSVHEQHDVHLTARACAGGGDMERKI